MHIEAILQYAGHQWDTDAISVVGLVLSSLHSAIFNRLRLLVDQSMWASGRDQFPSANPEDIEHWKCVDAALSHPDFSNLTNCIEWWNSPCRQFQQYKALIPELFRQLLPQFSSRVATTVEVRSAREFDKA